MNQPFYCQVLYPIQIPSFIEVLKFNNITLVKFQQLEDSEKQQMIINYADSLFGVSSISPVITDCYHDELNS
jgi:hypothetical protein